MIKKIDLSAKTGSPELLIVTIKTSKFLIEATIRENTNLTHLTDMINLFAEFKNYPKKFKEIF